MPIVDKVAGLVVLPEGLPALVGYAPWVTMKNGEATFLPIANPEFWFWYTPEDEAEAEKRAIEQAWEARAAKNREILYARLAFTSKLYWVA